MSTTTIKTTIAAGEIRVTSPYNSEFVNKARKLQGTFKNGAWVFPESVKEHVLKAVSAVYGTDGTGDYKTCILCVSEYSERAFGPIEMFGRTIARAFGRDSGAKLGEDIFLIEGVATSGGSVKNWRTHLEDATFEIHNFPVAALEREDVKEAISEGWATVKGLPAIEKSPEPAQNPPLKLFAIQQSTNHQGSPTFHFHFETGHAIESIAMLTVDEGTYNRMLRFLTEDWKAGSVNVEQNVSSTVHKLYDPKLK